MSEQYNKAFFEAEDYLNDEFWVPHFADVAERIIACFSPKTVLDAGCARGYLVAELRKRGVEAYGVDISSYAIESAPAEIAPYLYAQSLTDPLPKHFPQKFDLVISLEVLEHMLPDEGKRAIGLLCSYSDAVLFSSTPDDFENMTHVNVRQAEYWAKIFAEYSFFRDAVQSVDFAAPWAILFRKSNDIPSVIFDYEIAGRVREMQIGKGAERKGSVYFDCGEGFTANCKTDFTYYGFEATSGRIAVPAGCKAIRLDPIEGKFIAFSDPVIVTNCGVEKKIASNAAFVLNGHYYFENVDPQFLVRLDGRAENSVCWVEFIGHISVCSAARDINAISALLSEIGKRNKEIRECEAAKNALKEELTDLNRNYHAAIGQRAALQNEVAKWNTMYTVISTSASWKMTKPLRVILDFIKKVLRKITPRPLKKFLKCWRENGLKYTLRKVKDKLRHRQDYAAVRRPIYTAAELEAQKKVVFPRKIKFSILVPLYNTPEVFLKEMIRSVIDQTYSDWELCLADGSDNDHKYVGQICKKYADTDARILYRKLEKNLGISANTNACIEMASGDYIGLFDHDDLLHPAALYEVMRAICEQDADFVYTDENTFHKAPKDAYCPHFKPDYSPDTLRGYNYICHFSVFARSLLEKVGTFRPECDGSQDYDMILRLTEQAKNVVHIPKILYYWRAHNASVASDVGAKPYVIKAAHKALQDHLEREGLKGKVLDTVMPSMYRIQYEIQGEPLVSIIIANKDHIDDLKKCLASIREKTTYRNYEIVIVENNSTEPETFAFYEEAKERYGVKVVMWESNGNFNYSAINNFGLREAKGEYDVFLNNDIEILTPTWIEEMLMFVQREDVGAAGMMLYYPDDTIQHAGVILGIGGIAGHSHKHYERGSYGYMSRLLVAQNLSAVTAACMMVKASVMRDVHGFDETLAVAFNDVDLCMRIREAGYLIVFTPFAEAYHYESKSRGLEDNPEKIARFNREINRLKEKWGEMLKKGDPYYNRNLTLEYEDFRLK